MSRLYFCAPGLFVLALLLSGCANARVAVPVARVGAAAAPVVRLGAGIRGVGLIVEPDDGVRGLTRAIRDANRSIWLTQYMLTNKTILRALEYAHAWGVDVRVILERRPYGALTNPNLAAYNSLMAADIPVHWSSSRFRLTHEKGMLVDGATAYVMTTNFTRASFNSNREFDVVDRDPRDVAAVRALFLADWTDRPYVAADPNLPVSPTDARSLTQSLILSARHTLDIYAEELQDAAIARDLAAAARRGVRVRLILPAPVGADLDAPAVAVITVAGARVYRMPRSRLYAHAKAIVVDGRRAFVGSQNLSSASLDANRELGVILSDPAAIATIEATFAGDWRG